MKVTISTPSRFWAFSLAEQLQKRGHLHKLIVGYFNPNKNAKGYIIDRDKVVKNILPLVIGHLPKKLKLLKRWQFKAQYYSCELHDLWASKQLESCDIFVGWSSFCLKTLRAAKSLGALTIIERGSSHIMAQKELLEEEYTKFAIRTKIVDERVLQKEVNEYEEADFISIPSKFVERTFIQKGVSSEKLIQIPYGVSLDHFKSIRKEDNIFRIIHIGGNIRKGTHYLIQAMNELNLKNAELLIIGQIEKPIKPLLQKYNGELKVFSEFPHTELYKYYSQSSVYVIPSIEEGLAMVQAEAMACGLPVICSTNTGGEEIIRDSIDGFVVPVKNVETLKEKILYLFRNEDKRKEMGYNALERVKEFTWDCYGNRVIDTYNQLMKSRINCI